MPIPTNEEIRALHERYAPSPEAFHLVYTHSQIVCGIAEQLLGRCEAGIDADLVRAGSLLHDIGVYLLYGPSGEIDRADYVRHGVIGHDLLAGEGIAEELCRFCSCHTGMGLSRTDIRRQGLPIPAGDYLAESVEEEVVMYADKFHSKTDPPVFVSTASYLASLRRFGDDKASRFQSMMERFGEPDLAPLMSAHGHGLR
ncbi:HD domain-containing protein [Nocardiopsis mangrovi]|uniref:HD domain-containing protein n=1 Tax=Nocardiopsis mangrovi TaxID=1179818 RepID=A0ABV9DWW2_9ACTN